MQWSPCLICVEQQILPFQWLRAYTRPLDNGQQRHVQAYY